MRRWFILAVVVAQLGLLAFMAGQREWVLQTGRTLRLRTEPVDPTDPMRGAYVRLGYAFSRVEAAQCRGGLADWFADPLPERFRDREVFVLLRSGPSGLAEFVALTDRRPADGIPYIRGRADSTWGAGPLNVRCGLEALFMQQEKAKELEAEAVRQRWDAGRTIEVEAAVDDDGLAVLKGYRWEALGMTLKTVPGDSEVDAAHEYQVEALELAVKNHGDAPVSIWWPAESGRMFRLEPTVLWGLAECRWQPPVDPIPPRPEEIRVLAPGESVVCRLDLDAPEWSVEVREKSESKPRTMRFRDLATISGNVSCVVRYAPPNPVFASGRPEATSLWLVPLQSRRFLPSESRPR